MEGKGEFIHALQSVVNEFLNFLNVAISSYRVYLNYNTVPEFYISTNSSGDSSGSWSPERDSEKKFPISDDNFPYNYQSLLFPAFKHVDKNVVNKVRDTADIAELCVLENYTQLRCNQKKTIEQYRESVKDLMRQYQCRRLFCSSVKDMEDKLQHMLVECTSVENDNGNLNEKFRKSATDSLKILSYLEISIRFYNGKDLDSEIIANKTYKSNPDNELNTTVEILRTFYEAFNYITRIVTIIREKNLDPELKDFLKQQILKLSKSSNRMIIYIESHIFYKFLMEKLNNITRSSKKLKYSNASQLVELMQIMSNEANNLSLTFNKLVRHFDMKRGSKTSGELIRTSFNLGKLVKKFTNSIKKMLNFLITKNYHEVEMIKAEYVEEFVKDAKLILNSFLLEVNKIVKTTI